MVLIIGTWISIIYPSNNTLSFVGGVLNILKHLVLLNRLVDMFGTVPIKDT